MVRSKMLRLGGGVVVTAGLLLPALAVAQEARNDSVLTRPRPEIDPLGVRAGSFLIFPRLSVGAEYDDNIFAEEDDEEDDFIFTVTPRIAAESQWSRHELEVAADGEFGFFLNNDESDYQDYGVSVGGQLDITRDAALVASLGLAQEHEDREDPDDTGEEEVTQLFEGDLDILYRQEFARFFVQPSLRFDRLDFDDVDDVNNDDRDRLRSRGGLRLGYNLSPRIGVFVEGDYVLVRYDQTPDDGGVDRDSDGFSVELGTELDLTGILFGEVAVGYSERSYDDDELEDFGGVTASTGLTWNVTPLTSIIATADVGIEETTVSVGGEDASGVFRAATGVEVFHELRRNIIINGDLGYIRDDFEGVDRTDDRFLAGAGVEYILNRRLSVDAGYGFSTRNSDVDAAEFTRNVVRIGLTARL